MRGERKERKQFGVMLARSGDSAHSALSEFSARSLVRSFQFRLRQIAGMPDYERHIEHLRRCHPERAIPSERQYYEEFVRARYHDGPTRCC
jgi:uncharacterized short protein YbdD (DUF466 family)